jgi:hypothetical protein
MVGDGHGIHARAQALVHQSADGGHAVKDGVFGMDVKMCELRHNGQVYGFVKLFVGKNRKYWVLMMA